MQPKERLQQLSRELVSLRRAIEKREEKLRPLYDRRLAILCEIHRESGAELELFPRKVQEANPTEENDE